MTAIDNLQETLDTLKEQMSDEVYRQLCLKTQAVYNENKNKRKFKKITYEVQIDYAYQCNNGNIHMGELDRTKRSRIVSDTGDDPYGSEHFTEIYSNKYNCDKIKVGSVHSSIYIDEYESKVDHKYTYKVLSIEDY